jgi:hypothetical protein
MGGRGPVAIAAIVRTEVDLMECEHDRSDDE